MRRVDVSAVATETDPEDIAGFRAASARLGPGLGAEETGASVYDLPPGEALCPYHYEQSEEEWLLVLSGRPTLRDPGGRTELGPHDLLFFPTGPAGAHQVRNDSTEPVRVLMFSTVRFPAVSVYPDSGKVGVYHRDRSDNVIVPRAASVGYYHGEGA